MLIRWDDRDWDLDLTDLTNRQALAIEAEAGMTLGQWYDLLAGDDGEGFDSAHPQFIRLMTVIYWLILDQGGVKTRISEVEFPVLKFGQAFMAAAAAVEVPEQPEPDPTRPPAVSPPSPARSSQKRKKPAAGTGHPDG